ncbi:hypothetical protein EDD15DRAFT_2519705 [Pisolithus albus]|nr:hypothetical protein EDD15DRAFT_2519705 [Pisolithus albus]
MHPAVLSGGSHNPGGISENASQDSSCVSSRSPKLIRAVATLKFAVKFQFGSEKIFPEDWQILATFTPKAKEGTTRVGIARADKIATLTMFVCPWVPFKEVGFQPIPAMKQNPGSANIKNLECRRPGRSRSDSLFHHRNFTTVAAVSPAMSRHTVTSIHHYRHTYVPGAPYRFPPKKSLHRSAQCAHFIPPEGRETITHYSLFCGGEQPKCCGFRDSRTIHREHSRSLLAAATLSGFWSRSYLAVMRCKYTSYYCCGPSPCQAFTRSGVNRAWTRSFNNVRD